MDGRACARWVGKRKKGRSLGWERPLCERDPHVHLRGDCYSILTGMYEIGCVGENGGLRRVQGIGETREETTLSERIQASVSVLE